MSTEVTVDQRSLPQAGAPDPDVKLPPSVIAAAARAEAIHAQAYATAQPEPQPQPAPVVQPQPAPVVQPQPAPVVQAQPAPQPVEPEGTPAAEALTPEQWRHRYLSMEGRFRQSNGQLNEMQNQVAEISDELMRTQTLVRQQPVPQVQPQPAPVAQSQSLITDKDVADYGSDLLDFVQRAARQAVQPDLQRLDADTAAARETAQKTAITGVYALLDERVPAWREINHSARFKQWLRLPDLYSGAVRGSLLNRAFQAADAPRVARFFQGFLEDEAATTGEPQPQPTLQPAPVQPAHQPALSLESLAAPGRARPAGSQNADPNQPVDKPIYTRAQISAFYARVRRGEFIGNETEKVRIERDIFSAQNEGRVR